MKLHLGCGNKDFGEEWSHIDGDKCLEHTIGTDITCQTLGENSADIIYASHLLEYFDRSEAIILLNNWNRVLKKGGILRLSVPNFESLIDIYRTTLTIEDILGPLYGKMRINENEPYVYHKTVYTTKSLEILMHATGFKDINKWDWKNTDHTNHDDHSQAYYPHMDKTKGIQVSLNLQGIKR
jgi:predicted SAM-dependent methyltransferase